jgi:hypothetical protein
MANLKGEERNIQTEVKLFTGIALGIPIAINPTVEALSAATNGRVAFKKDIDYTSEDGLRVDMWYKFEYTEDEDGEIVQRRYGADEEVFYEKATVWLSDNDDETEKGAWYVNTKTLDKHWITEENKGDYADKLATPTVHKAKKGEKELFDLLRDWLNIKVVDFQTPFAQLLAGNFREISEIIKENLEDELIAKGVQMPLYLNEYDGKLRQKIYTKKTLPGKVTSTLRLYEAVQKDTYLKKDVFSHKLQKYNPVFEESSNKIKPSSTPKVVEPNASAWS